MKYSKHTGYKCAVVLGGCAITAILSNFLISIRSTLNPTPFASSSSAASSGVAGFLFYGVAFWLIFKIVRLKDTSEEMIFFYIKEYLYNMDGNEYIDKGYNRFGLPYSKDEINAILNALDLSDASMYDKKDLRSKKFIRSVTMKKLYQSCIAVHSDSSMKLAEKLVKDEEIKTENIITRDAIQTEEEKNIPEDKQIPIEDTLKDPPLSNQNIDSVSDSKKAKPVWIAIVAVLLCCVALFAWHQMKPSEHVKASSTHLSHSEYMALEEGDPIRIAYSTGVEDGQSAAKGTGTPRDVTFLIMEQSDARRIAYEYGVQVGKAMVIKK